MSNAAVPKDSPHVVKVKYLNLWQGESIFGSAGSFTFEQKPKHCQVS